MTIIESLWYGDIAMNERKIENDEEYNKITQLIIRQEGELKKSLSKEQNELYDKLRSNLNERLDLSACDAFATGFKLGVRMMCEATK